MSGDELGLSASDFLHFARRPQYQVHGGWRISQFSAGQ
jgi:hypothetical protein